MTAKTSKLQGPVLGGIVALYLAVRLWRLDASCLWFDEIFGVHAAEMAWDSILSFVALDLIHPPLFYVLLKCWIGIGGEGLLWLRLLPVVFSLIAIFPVLALFGELKLGLRTQMLALLLIAVNGSLIKYAQEVRMYSLLMCLSLFSMWLFARYFTKGKSFAALLIVNILMVYTHYFGWFVVLAEVALILCFERLKWRPILVMFAGTFVGFLPWAVAVWRASQSGSGLGQNIGWVSKPRLRELGSFVFNTIEPFYFQASTAEPMSIFRITVPLLLIIAIAVIVHAGNFKSLDESERRHIFFLLFFVKLPILITFAASWVLPYSVWGTRHLIIIFAPLSIYLAITLTFRSVRWLPAAAITFLLLFAGYGLALKATKESLGYTWCAWETLAKNCMLTPRYSAEPRRIIALEELIGYHLWFAARPFPNNEIKVVKGFAGTKEDNAYFLPRGFDEVRIEDAASFLQGGEFWVAFRDTDPRNDTSHPAFLSYSPPVLIELERLGYEAEDARRMKIGSEYAFLVKMLPRSTAGSER